ncbi:alkaline phosphatase family protein [Conexibacter stalactiti]|uniref:Alkaline phosphatase family protein n=1 Tax=Conexibacter stalactiti TaxID=1940611 RepID=A0ABU4HSY5_9ACTN|nr:alkaline phosphatase family protein [Conexibacter stalactiti]MDW5596433.1 alkaline phosphatase family protein [Conexibacter stalactiti]MEC5037075.1 alkaline phosphatase family protein [Conexibacter stalactiti]
MSRAQLWALGVLSLLATALVLFEGGRGAVEAPLALRTAAQSERTITTPLLASAITAEQDTDDDASGDEEPAEDDAAETVESFDDTAVAESAAEEPAATADEEAPAEEETSDEGTDDAPTDPNADAAAPKPTKIRHVFVIALAGHGFDAAFGPQSSAPYLAGRLRPRGVVLEGFRALGAAQLPDHLAQVGGQPPNAQTSADCPSFTEIPLATTPTRTGEIRADGCVFPNTVTTIGDQLTASRRVWRAYVQDLDKGPERRATCRRPASNAADDTLRDRAGDGYATRRNPFVYFHSLLDLGDCDALDGPLERLERDLGKVATTPNYSYVAPNLCNSGSESPCADGSPGGLPAADAFLASWVPKILASPAYRRDGLLIVTFAGRTVAAGAPAPAAADLRNGALLLSRFAAAGTTAGGDYDPYSLLRSIEDLFALRPLARAATARSFAPTVLGNAYVTPPGDG